jgi:hypothetical protein
MIQFNDKLNVFAKKLPSDLNVHRLSFQSNNPAKFYILPKVHKPFAVFPKGRPISSTFRKNNKYVSRLLDLVLKPCMYEISDLLIDTQHFLLSLQMVKLSPDRKYKLITIDVEALYPSLIIADCKKHCIESYLRNKHLCKTLDLNYQGISDLLSLSLDYNYVAFQDQLFFQYKGIEMGNAASVSVANITVFHELKSIFANKKEIIFNKRFLDDIFVILDVTEMSNVENWLNDMLVHKYLKFTHEMEDHEINFLDVKIKLDSKNNIYTELFQKPVSKHVYLHAKSDHPSHLKNSLFYSQGLRMVRICSNFSTRIGHLIDLYNKFISRGYTSSLLYPTLLRLIHKDRFSALKPNKELLISYLHVQNPAILAKYNIQASNKVIDKFSTENNVFLVFPFFKCIPFYKQKIKHHIITNLTENCKPEFNHIVKELKLNIVFSRTKNLKEMVSV